MCLCVCRFSLDTRSIESDGEQDDQSQSQSSAEEFTTSGETELSKSTVMPNLYNLLSFLIYSHTFTHTNYFALWQPPTPERMVYSRSEIVSSDEKSQAERVSRILETSKQAARAAGGEELISHTQTNTCHLIFNYITV